MSHQDTGVHSVSAPHHQALRQALDWLLNSASLSGLAFRSDCTWTPRSFVFAAILWAWSDERTLTDRFFHARKVVMTMIGLAGPPARSYQAFLKMLKSWSLAITVTLVDAFRGRMRTDLAERLRVHGFSIFGVDGSRPQLPRTESNEQRFSPTGAARKRESRSRPEASEAHAKKADSPQMWLTMMFHVGTGLPWDWRVGPSNSSEREHFQQMIHSLPDGALVTADAGFVGYQTWKKLLDSGRQLLIRVGANICLLKDLGYVERERGLVYLWPDREAARDHPPLVLRLVVAEGGERRIYLVTSVLDEARLSDRQAVEIYALRWGVELLYRHFKQTFERCKLRSHDADHAELEATWSLLGLWSMSLHAQVELMHAGIPARRVSVAKFLRAYRGSLREYKTRPDPGEALPIMLRKAIVDPYKRASKASRDHPRKKKGHAIGAPEIRAATRYQIKRARSIRDRIPLGLTA